MLWICQRSELAQDAELHSESTPLEDAAARYRPDPDQEDIGLASVFWEACWTESIADLLYDAIGETVGDSSTAEPSSQRRLPYRLTTDPDSEGQLGSASLPTNIRD